MALWRQCQPSYVCQDLWLWIQHYQWLWSRKWESLLRSSIHYRWNACQCRYDSDCINGGSCGQPSCVADITPYCSIAGHNVDWSCPPTCDQPCDTLNSNHPHCYVLAGEALCGCLNDFDCTFPEVCAYDPRSRYCVISSTTGYVECAKQCGCALGFAHDGMSPGCSPAYPRCVNSSSGPTCMECAYDSDCTYPEVCGTPSCISDRPLRCDTRANLDAWCN